MTGVELAMDLMESSAVGVVVTFAALHARSKLNRVGDSIERLKGALHTMEHQLGVDDSEETPLPPPAPPDDRRRPSVEVSAEGAAPLPKASLVRR